MNPLTCTSTVAAIEPLKTRLDDLMHLKPGQIVKYSDPQPGEELFRFTLLENYDGRAKIQLHCDWRIQPIESVRDTDIVPA